MITWGWAVAAMLFGAYVMSCWNLVRDKKRILDLERVLSTLLHCFESQRYYLDMREDPRSKDFLDGRLEEKIIYAQLLAYGASRALLGRRHQPYVEDIARGRNLPLFVIMRESQARLEKEMTPE